MTARRCPNCGGLVGPDVEWCGQCFARVEPAGWSEPPGPSGPPAEPSDAAASDPESAVTAPQTPARPRREPGADRPAGDGSAVSPRPPGPAAGVSGLRVEPEGIIWTCPVCEAENPLDRPACQRCGTPFGRLFEPEAPPPRISPQRAAILSLLFPGIGHLAAGKLAEGMARAVVFAFSVGMVLAILLGAGEIGGPLIPLLVLFAGVSATLYVGTAVDAYREVQGEAPVLTTRMLLIGATVLLLVAMVVLVLGGSQASV